MAPFDDDLDDEDLRASRHGNWADGTNDDWDDPDERDLPPDEITTVRCTHCRKWILEDSPRCPYCKEMQPDDRDTRHPAWIVIAAVIVLLSTLLYYVFSTAGIVSGFHL